MAGGGGKKERRKKEKRKKDRKKERKKDRKMVYFLNTAYKNTHKFSGSAVSNPIQITKITGVVRAPNFSDVT